MAAAMLNLTGSSNAFQLFCRMRSYVCLPNLVEVSLITVHEVLGCLDIFGSNSFDLLECIWSKGKERKGRVFM